MSVLFLDCTKSAQVRIIKIKLLSYFWNIHPKFSQKGKGIASKTVKYFQDIGGRDIPKSRYLLLRNWLLYEIFQF